MVRHGVEKVVEVLLEQRVAGTALELGHDVRVDAPRRALGVALLERRRWDVGDVGVPEMEEEEEVLVPVLADPREPDAVDHRSRGPGPARGRQVVVIASDEPVLHGEEVVDRAGDIAVAPQQRWQPQRLLGQIGGGVEVGDDAGLDPELAGEQRGVRRLRRYVSGVRLRVEGALPGDPVQVGGQPPPVAKAAQVVGPERVERADDEVHAHPHQVATAAA
jgi:hypothetical protein